MMTETTTIKEIKEDSPAVQSHLVIMQNVIARMATNSTACKTWCITIVSAILVVVADKEKPDYVYIAIIPTLLFLALDTYYLMHEKMFRNSYDSFIRKLHKEDLEPEDVFVVKPAGKNKVELWNALKSAATWPFYFTLLAMIFFTGRLLK